jgi:hypothetical protein
MSERQPWEARKVVIVGAGAVGSTFAYALAQSGLAEEIALIDLNRDLVKGQVLDLAHGVPFFPPVQIHVEGWGGGAGEAVQRGALRHTREKKRRINLIAGKSGSPCHVRSG